jgi:hypothetical protein
MIKDIAIRVLYPQVTVTSGDSAFDESGTPVSYDEAAVQALMASEAYKEQRRAAYPSIADQLDLLYHGGMDAWKASIKAVKDQYPKNI